MRENRTAERRSVPKDAAQMTAVETTETTRKRRESEAPMGSQIYVFPLPVRWDTVPERTDLPGTDVFVHENLGNAFLLRKQYVSEGWKTNVVLQGTSHKGPTTSIAIGHPKEWPDQSRELSRWGTDVILRLHVDICRIQGKLASCPHIEPDPEYNLKEHLDMYRKSNEIRGPIALQILREFFFFV